ncbi:hypothetical protein [Flindersiella endophytica]
MYAHAAESVIDSARRGVGDALFVVGAPGLGKTSLLDSVPDRAEPGFRVGRGTADPMETSLPFGLLDQALVGLGARVILEADDLPGEAESHGVLGQRVVAR